MPAKKMKVKISDIKLPRIVHVKLSKIGGKEKKERKAELLNILRMIRAILQRVTGA